MKSRFIVLTLSAAASLWAQSAPTLAVDATVSRHPISPLIYGINEWPSYNDTTHVWTDSGMSEAMRVGVRRWGGDNATSYNWQLDIKNNDSDWYFTTYVVGDGVNSTFDLFHEQNLRTGTLSLGTVPVLDWTPKLISGQPLLFNVPLSCSYSVAKYGAQKQTDPYDPDCGLGVLTNGNQISNDPTDVYQQITPAFAAQWVQSILNKYGPANQGGVQMWSLDNEPEWWDNVHMDMYHQPATYDDMLERDIAVAQVVKAADPTALITGPVPGGWSGMLFSKKDMDAGWGKNPYCYWDNPVDQNAHGKQPWIVYFLQQMQQFEQQNGYRLLDYLDVHGYITPPGVGFDNTINSANTALRLTSTRAFWDPTYIVPGFTNCSGYSDANGNQVAPASDPHHARVGEPRITPTRSSRSPNTTGARSKTLPARWPRRTFSAYSAASSSTWRPCGRMAASRWAFPAPTPSRSSSTTTARATSSAKPVSPPPPTMRTCSPSLPRSATIPRSPCWC